MNAKLIHQIVHLRLAVGFPGERGQAGWAAGRAFNSSSATNALGLRPAEIASTPMPMRSTGGKCRLSPWNPWVGQHRAALRLAPFDFLPSG
jgi:hypothetical protein